MSDFDYTDDENYNDSIIILDLGATMHLVNEKIATNLKKEKKYKRVKGIAGNIIISRNTGYVGCMKVWTNDNIGVNIFSMSKISKVTDVEFDGIDFGVRVGNNWVKFENNEGLYKCELSKWLHACEGIDITWEDEEVNVGTVSDNEAHLTKKQIVSARRAREFLVRAGHPSIFEAKRLVENGYVRGLEFEAEDLETCKAVYGKSVAYVKGRMKKKKAGKIKESEKFDKCDVVSQELYSDIFYLKSGKPYLISVAKPLNLVLTTRLGKGKDAAAMEEGFRQHINVLKSRGFRVDKISSDPESSIEVLEYNIGGVEFNIGGAGDHVPIADSKIKSLKEIIRSVSCGLEWEVPDNLEEALVRFSTHRINCYGGDKDRKPPRVSFTANYWSCPEC